MREAWIVEAVRTRGRPLRRRARPGPLGRPAASAIRGCSSTAPVIDPALIEDVILGCANQAGEDNRDVARTAPRWPACRSRSADWTVNRLCGSGLQGGELRPRDRGRRRRRVHRRRRRVDDAGAVRHGEARRGLGPRRAAAVRHDPRLAVRQPGARGDALPVLDGRDRRERGRTLGGRAGPAGRLRPRIAAKAVAAIESGRFDAQIIPISAPQRKRRAVSSFRAMRLPRADTHQMRASSGRRSARRDGHRRQQFRINDGASAVLLVEASRARELGPGRLRGSSTAVAGVDPAIMGYGPVPDAQALDRAGIGAETSTSSSFNEAFASQSIVCINELGLDPDTVNVNGGAIALGHPLGMSGARLITMLAHELVRTAAATAWRPCASASGRDLHGHRTHRRLGWRRHTTRRGVPPGRVTRLPYSRYSQTPPLPSQRPSSTRRRGRRSGGRPRRPRRSGPARPDRGR